MNYRWEYIVCACNRLEVQAQFASGCCEQLSQGRGGRFSMSYGSLDMGMAELLVLMGLRCYHKTPHME